MKYLLVLVFFCLLKSEENDEMRRLLKKDCRTYGNCKPEKPRCNILTGICEECPGDLIPGREQIGCPPTCAQPIPLCRAGIIENGCTCPSGQVRKHSLSDECVPKRDCCQNVPCNSFPCHTPQCTSGSAKCCDENKICTDKCVNLCAAVLCLEGTTCDPNTGLCTICTKPNEIWDGCGPCDSTCDKNIACILICDPSKAGCGCKPNYVRNKNGDCIEKEQCPNNECTSDNDCDNGCCDTTIGICNDRGRDISGFCGSENGIFCQNDNDCKSGQICVDDARDECDPTCTDKECIGLCVTPDNNSCRGIAGILCPKGSICYDDLTDDCSINCGGADCSGICAVPSLRL